MILSQTEYGLFKFIHKPVPPREHSSFSKFFSGGGRRLEKSFKKIENQNSQTPEVCFLFKILNSNRFVQL